VTFLKIGDFFARKLFCFQRSNLREIEKVTNSERGVACFSRRRVEEPAPSEAEGTPRWLAPTTPLTGVSVQLFKVPIFEITKCRLSAWRSRGPLAPTTLFTNVSGAIFQLPNYQFTKLPNSPYSTPE
jgi:hypothetical protein